MIQINNTNNSVVLIKPNDGHEFEHMYAHDIRPVVDWHTARQVDQTKQLVITTKRELGKVYTIWGRDGLPWYMVKKIKISEAAKKKTKATGLKYSFSGRTVIFRLPAIEWKGKIMLLDGNNRATWLYKWGELYVVILDILVLPDDSNSVLDIVTGGLNE